MKKIIKDSEIAFGVSLLEHQKKAQHIYDTVVKPQLDADQKLKDQGLFVDNPILSPLLKSYANCENHI